MKTIKIKVVRENETTGSRTWAFENFDEARLFIKEAINIDIVNTMRENRISNVHGVTFKSGVGYDIVDADLLGGTSSGELRYQLESKGVEIIKI